MVTKPNTDSSFYRIRPDSTPPKITNDEKPKGKQKKKPTQNKDELTSMKKNNQ